jgi:hypothetical protein
MFRYTPSLCLPVIHSRTDQIPCSPRAAWGHLQRRLISPFLKLTWMLCKNIKNSTFVWFFMHLQVLANEKREGMKFVSYDRHSHQKYHRNLSICHLVRGMKPWSNIDSTGLWRSISKNAWISVVWKLGNFSNYALHVLWTVMDSNVKNKRTNVPISFWKQNQNVLVSFPNFSCWEQIVLIKSTLSKIF